MTVDIVRHNTKQNTKGVPWLDTKSGPSNNEGGDNKMDSCDVTLKCIWKETIARYKYCIHFMSEVINMTNSMVSPKTIWPFTSGILERILQQFL